MKLDREQLHQQYIPERFSLKKLLGSGGFGFVYEAFDHERETTIALKALTEVTPTSLMRFKREFRSLADIVHPNLITLYELHSDGNLWFFTMELIQGNTFFDHVYQTILDAPSGTSAPTPIQSESIDMLDTQEWTTQPGLIKFSEGEQLVPGTPRFDRDRLHPALVQLTRGIQILHDANKLHRDIKPSNVLVSQQGRVVVLDFGLIQDIAPHGTDAFLKEKETRFIGTPHYMSPEQAMGEKVGAASDWYSVGVMLYQLLTGDYPIRGNSNLQILMRKQSMEPKHVHDLNPDAPEDLAELCMRLLQRDPEQRANGDDILCLLNVSRATTSARTLGQKASFVGRVNELETLKAHFKALRLEHTPTLATVVGPSGIGKSALCQRFLRHVHKYDNICILQSRCYENETVPYKAFDGILEQLAQHLNMMDDEHIESLLPTHMEALTRLFPALLRVPVIEQHTQQYNGPNLDINSPHHRQRAFEALSQLMTNVGHLNTMVLYLDDVQWADEESAQLLEHLWSQGQSPPCMMLISHRPDDITHPFLATLNALSLEDHHAQRVDFHLSTLNTQEAEQVVFELLSQTPSVAKYIDHIIEEAAGNPFFIDELTRFARQNPQAFEEHTEQSLDDILYLRIENLPDYAKNLLELISLSGHPLAMMTAHKASKHQDKLQDALALLRSELLIRIKTNHNTRILETYHDRIRETVAARVPKKRAKSHHLRLAKTLSNQKHAEPEQIALHFIRAEHQNEAIPYLTQAAQQSERAMAFEHAARLYETLLTLKDWPEEQATTLHHHIGRLRGWLGQGKRASEHFQQAAQTAPKQRAFDLHCMAANQLIRVGHYDEGLALFDQLLAQTQLKRPKNNAALIGSILKNRTKLFWQGIQPKLQPIAQIDRRTTQRLDLCWSLSQSTSVFDLKLGAHFSLQHLMSALDSGHPHHLACGMMVEAIFQSSTHKNRAKGTQLLLQAQSLIEHSNDRDYAQGLMCFSRGMGAYLSEQWTTAIEQWQEGIDFLQTTRPELTWEVEGMRFYRLTAIAQTGDYRPLIAEMPNLIQSTQSRQDIHYGTAYKLWYYQAQLAQDEPQKAKQTIEQINPILDQASSYRVHHYWRMLASVNIALYQQNDDEAWLLAQTEWTPLKRSMLLQNLDIAHIIALDTYGRAALAYSLNHPKAAQAVRQTIKKLHKLPYKSARGYALTLDAQLQWHQTGQWPTEQANEALTILRDNQMHMRALCLQLLIHTATQNNDSSDDILHALTQLGVVNPIQMATLFVPTLKRSERP